MFPNLKELISTFEKPDQGLVVPLLKAVERSRPCLRWRRSTIELDGTYGKSCHSCGSKGTFIPLPPVHTADSTQMSFSAEVAPRWLTPTTPVLWFWGADLLVTFPWGHVDKEAELPSGTVPGALPTHFAKYLLRVTLSSAQDTPKAAGLMRGQAPPGHRPPEVTLRKACDKRQPQCSLNSDS